MTIEDFPLFPLPVVLFPGMILPLHIFEERYKLMTSRCLATDGLFGVVLARSGHKATDEDQTYRVGTIARIVKVAKYEDGRMDILTVGKSRFRIHQTNNAMPYLRGRIEIIEDSDKQPGFVGESEEVYRLFEEYRALLADEPAPITQVPREPEKLSYIGHFLDIELRRKQELLEMTSVSERLTNLRACLRMEITLLKYLGPTRTTGGPSRFSLN